MCIEATCTTRSQPNRIRHFQSATGPPQKRNDLFWNYHVYGKQRLSQSIMHQHTVESLDMSGSSAVMIALVHVFVSLRRKQDTQGRSYCSRHQF